LANTQLKTRIAAFMVRTPTLFVEGTGPAAPAMLTHRNGDGRRSRDNCRMQVASYLKLSVATAVATIALKTGAWWLTDSVGLLSDALESLVNLAGALFALVMVTIAAH